MSAGGLWMSGEEGERSHLIRETQAGQLSQRAASERLGIGVRQVKRLVRLWKQHGDAGLVSRQRGRPSNHRFGQGQRDRIGVLLRERYPVLRPDACG